MKQALPIAMAGVLLACGYSEVRSREFQLKHTLYTLNTVADEYAFDHQTWPRTLDDLVRSDYLSAIPVDPMTGSRVTWRMVMTASGKIRVKSGSTKIGLDGKRYSDW